MSTHWDGKVVDGRYEVLGSIGQGGMGIVLRAKHKYTGADVALKVLHPHLRLHGDLANRFLAEARAAAAIGHPGIAAVTDAGKTPEGDLYLAMELLQGVSLGALMKRGPMPLGDIVRIATDVLDALGAAHAAGFVHRDLKPDNIFITHPTGAVKLLDFGIAKVVSEIDPAGSTATGAVMGTIAYMSPEQLRDSRKVDRRTDIWALGVTIYQMAAGALPYQAETFGEMLLGVMSRPPRRLTEHLATVPPGLEPFLAKALTIDPNGRFASAAEMRDALKALVASPGAKPAPMAPVAQQAPPMAQQAQPMAQQAPPMAPQASPHASGYGPQGHAAGQGPPGYATGQGAPGYATGQAAPGYPTGPGGPPAPAQGAAQGIASAMALLPPMPGAHGGSQVPVWGGGPPPPGATGFYPPDTRLVAPADRDQRLVIGVAAGCLVLVVIVGALIVLGIAAGSGASAPVVPRDDCAGQSCYTLGLAHEKGDGVEDDDEHAVALYRRACDDGYQLGCNALGNSYMNGFGGLDQDHREARKLYEKACERGAMEACHNMGWLHLNGLGVPKDAAKAKAFFAKSCSGGNTASCEQAR